jgi:hypothetical protein
LQWEREHGQRSQNPNRQKQHKILDAIEARDGAAIVAILTERSPTFTGRELDRALSYEVGLEEAFGLQNPPASLVSAPLSPRVQKSRILLDAERPAHLGRLEGSPITPMHFAFFKSDQPAALPQAKVVPQPTARPSLKIRQTVSRQQQCNDINIVYLGHVSKVD